MISRTEFPHAFGARPSLPATIHVATGRSPEDAAAMVRTLDAAVHRFAAAVDPALLGPLLLDPLEVVLDPADHPIDARGGLDQLTLGGLAPVAGMEHPVHDDLDVVAHEFGHMLWQRAAGKRHHEDPSVGIDHALSESFADVVAMTVTDFDPRIAEAAGAHPLRIIGRPDAETSELALRRLLAPGTKPWNTSANYALGEFVSNAYLLARSAIGDGPAIDAWLGGALTHGRRVATLAPDEHVASFREATIAAAGSDEAARAIRAAWSDALAPLASAVSDAAGA